MATLLAFREWLKNLYAGYSLYIMAGIRFLTTLVITLLINQNIGFMNRLNTPVVALLLAMVSAFLPAGISVFFAAVLIVLHLSAVSMELMLVTALYFLVIVLVYFRFSPKYSFVLLLTPVAFALKMPVLVPLIIGTVAAPAAVVPLFFGGTIYFLLHNIAGNTLNLLRTGSEGEVQTYLYILENTIKSSEMYLVLLVAVLTTLIVRLIRRLSIDHAWTIAVVTGTIFNVLVYLIGDFVLDIETNVPVLILGAIVSLVIAYFLQFFLFSVDYVRTEYAQFEDDEYYYYVKAVPKVKITKSKKTVKRINPQKKVREERTGGGSTTDGIREL